MGRKEIGPAAWEYPFQEESAWKTVLGTEVVVPELPATWQEALPALRSEGFAPWYMPNLGFGKLLQQFEGAPTEVASAMMVESLQKQFPNLAPRKRNVRFLQRHLALSHMQYAVGPYPRGQWILTTNRQENLLERVPLTRYINMPQTRWHQPVEGSNESMALYDRIKSLSEDYELSAAPAPSVPTALEHYLLSLRGAITPVAAEWTATKVLGPASSAELSCVQDGVRYEGRRFDFNYLYVDNQGKLGIQHGKCTTTHHHHLKSDPTPTVPLTLRPLIREDRQN